MSSDGDSLAQALHERHGTNRVLADQLAHFVVAEGWRPPVYQTADPDHMNSLPIGSIVLDPAGHAWHAEVHAEHLIDRRWSTPFGTALASSVRVLAHGAVTVVHTATETR